MADQSFEFKRKVARARAAAAEAEQAAPAADAPAPLTPEEQAGIDDLNARQRDGGASVAERNIGRAISFLSGSPLFGTVARAADSLTGRDSMAAANQATQQFSPTIPKAVPLIGGAPVLPMLGGMVATAPAGAASIGRGVLTPAGASLLRAAPGLAMGAKAAMAGRVGVQGVVGGATAADRGGDAGDIALGTGAGLAGGVLGEGIGAGLGKLAETVRPAAARFANSQAVKALLGGGTMVNRLKNQLGITNDASLQNLGADVRGLGVLGRAGIPRNAQGINEGVEGVLAGSGGEIGRIRDLADSLVASGKAAPADAVQMAQAYEQGVLGASRLADQADVAPAVMQQGQKFIRQATPPLNGVPTTEGGTFRALWDQSSRMQRGSFKPTDSLGDALANRELSRAGVQSARSNLSQQMESVVGPDEMSSLADAMRRYSTAARISDVTADTAARSVARNTFGLGDNALVQTMGLTGPAAAAALPFVSLLRSRGNAAAAMYAPPLAKAAAPALGLAGAGARLGTPAALREKPDEAEAVDAFLKAP